ncbi:ABC transporter substrate-binding protein [Hartmannibacter diazotrophicus]|nr:ABC transporter substrate-binding protein [Hartmannibacter diazotrophicus]
MAVAPSQHASAQDAHFGYSLAAPENTLTIWGSTDIAAFGPAISTFVDRNPGVAVTYVDINTNELYEKTAGACAENRPASDLVISSAVDLQVSLANDGCASAHASDLTGQLPSWANWRNEVFGFTFEPVVIVYNRAGTPFDGMTISRFDLIDLLRTDEATYSGKVATYDIEDSGVGYLFAFMDSQQATTFGRLVESFGRNKVVATCCAEEILDGVAEGRYLVAYNMLGSYAIARARWDDRIGVLFPTDYTLVLARAALIPKQAENRALAGRFIDFLLSDKGRGVLEDTDLIARPHNDLPSGEGLDLPGDSLLRPIALTPVLLVGLDQEKRRLFLDIWKSSIAPVKDAP